MRQLHYSYLPLMWATEVVHLAVTSLIILFIQPIIGVANFTDVVIGFANPIIFLIKSLPSLINRIGNKPRTAFSQRLEGSSF